MYLSGRTLVSTGVFLYKADTKSAVPCASLVPNRVREVCQFFLIVQLIQPARYRPDQLRCKRFQRFWYDCTG